MRKALLYFFGLILLFTHANATHIVGGVMDYECLGNNQYRVTLTIYRDCAPGTAPFDQSVTIAIYNSSNNLANTLNINFNGFTTLQPTISNDCFPAPNNVCIQQAKYIQVVTLPPITGGYTLVHQRCCRNGTIINIQNASNVGSTFSARIPGPESAVCNSSPSFNNLPPIFLCVGKQFRFNHAATDIDGDQLVYSFCSPFNGGTPNDPIPNPPKPPPFTPATFIPPYTTSAPISSSPPMSIDPVTGLITITPNVIGNFVFAVCVEEYRNGVLLGVTMREFQFTVINCTTLITANMADPNGTASNNDCTSFTINFINASANATHFLWNFGDPTNHNDTSTAPNVDYAYPGPGTYNVTLIANPGDQCADTAMYPVTVKPLLFPDFTVPNGQCFTPHNYNFAIDGIFAPAASVDWEFPNANPLTAIGQTTQGVKFTAPGTYPVTMNVEQMGCIRQIQKNVVVHPDVVAQIEPQLKFCYGFTYDFKNHSQNASSYLWQFGDHQNPAATSTAIEPSYNYSDTGVYTITLIATGLGCSDSVSETFTIHPLLNAVIGINDKVQCFNGNSFNFEANGSYQALVDFEWNFGTAGSINTSNNPNENNISFSSPGPHIITLKLEENGCTSIAQETIICQLEPQANFKAMLRDGCIPFLVEFENLSTAESPLMYRWGFGNGQGSAAESPGYLYASPGSYTIGLWVKSTAGCIDSSYFEIPGYIVAHPLPKGGFIAESYSAGILEPYIVFTDTSKENSWHQFIFEDGYVSTSGALTYSFPEVGEHIIKHIAYNQFGCTDTSSATITIYPEFEIYIPNAFSPNGDRLNEIFKPVAAGVTEYEITIYNRWGQQVFKSTRPEIGWDGTINGAQAPSGVYTYSINLVSTFSAPYQYAGHFSLVR
jgi:gliding motility-associated-like protein